MSGILKYVYVDPNCNLVACETNGRFHIFNTEAEFDEFINYADMNSFRSKQIYATIEQEMDRYYF